MDKSHVSSVTIEMVILNYNGIHHLEVLIPTALNEASLSHYNCKVVVIDNQSTTGDVAWLKCNYPNVIVWSAPSNGFLYSYNAYARFSKAEYLILLNNDLRLAPNFVDPLVSHLCTSSVFSVSATSRDWDDSRYTFGPVSLCCHHGHFFWQPDYKNQQLCYTLFTSGGFMAVSRKKFLEIGGFSTLFYPAYCEDLDLCFRAWLAGYTCIFEPASLVYHHESSSWGSRSSTAKTYRFRHSLYFKWCYLGTRAWDGGSLLYLACCMFREVWAGEAWRIKTRLVAFIRWTLFYRHRYHRRVSTKIIKSLCSIHLWPYAG